MTAATVLPDGPWLNVGSGPSSPQGWVSTDASWQTCISRVPRPLTRLAELALGRPLGHWPREVGYHDLLRGLPHADRTVAVVYASHVLEHLYRDDALAFLVDARRVLKPGGVVRVVVPDVGAIVGWYLDARNGEEPGRASDLLMQMLMLRPGARPRRRIGSATGVSAIHEHKWMYDAAGLASLVREAGFDDAAPCSFLESAIPREALERVELASRICDGAGVCVEARR